MRGRLLGRLLLSHVPRACGEHSHCGIAVRPGQHGQRTPRGAQPMAAQEWTDLAQRAGAHLAATLGEQPAVQALWASADDEGLELWLVTAPTDGAVTLQLHAAI